MNLNRRGLLGMFAAGVGAAVLPSGIIMPVRKIITAAPGVWNVPAGAPISQYGSITNFRLYTTTEGLVTFNCDEPVQPGDSVGVRMERGRPSLVIARRNGQTSVVHYLSA